MSLPASKMPSATSRTCSASGAHVSEGENRVPTAVDVIEQVQKVLAACRSALDRHLPTSVDMRLSIGSVPTIPGRPQTACRLSFEHPTSSLPRLNSVAVMKGREGIHADHMAVIVGIEGIILSAMPCERNSA